MQEAREKFTEQGLRLAAISYDSLAILSEFSQRHGIGYPLIADPNSEIIQKYGVLNPEAKGFTKGMAYPGYFFITPEGKIKEKFFETAYTDRYTANNLLLKIFPELVEGSGRELSAPHIKLTLLQSDKIVVPGSRFTIAIEVELAAGMHVYAPGVKGYKPVELALEAPPELKLQPVRYPEARVLYLPAIKESVPVFEGKFRVFQDVVVSADRSFVSSLGTGIAIPLKGTLLYQACDSKECYVPQRPEVSWEVQVIPLDRQRSPESIQHR